MYARTAEVAAAAAAKRRKKTPRGKGRNDAGRRDARIECRRQTKREGKGGQTTQAAARDRNDCIVKYDNAERSKRSRLLSTQVQMNAAALRYDALFICSLATALYFFILSTFIFFYAPARPS